MIFAGYTGSKNPVRWTGFSNLIFKKSSTDGPDIFLGSGTFKKRFQNMGCKKHGPYFGPDFFSGSQKDPCFQNSAVGANWMGD